MQSPQYAARLKRAFLCPGTLSDVLIALPAPAAGASQQQQPGRLAACKWWVQLQAAAVAA